MWTRGKRKAAEEMEVEAAKKDRSEEHEEGEEEGENELELSGASDTLVLNATKEFDDDVGEEEEKESEAEERPKKRAAAYDEVLPAPTTKTVEEEETTETRKRLSLSERLNLRSRPPHQGSTSVEKTPPRLLSPPPTSSLPDTLPLRQSSPLPGPSKLPLRQRLNLRSRPVVLPPGAESHQTPPRPPPVVDPNRTPEQPRTPPPVLSGEAEEDDDSSGPLDGSFARSVNFSLNASQDLDASVASGEPGFSGESDSDEQGDDGDAKKREAADRAKVSELNTSMVDQLLEAEKDQEEVMDWDDVDPGLLEELQVCRRELLAQGDGGGEGTLASLDFSGKNTATDDNTSRLMLVVDTNIFISQLKQLRQLVASHPGSPQESVTIYIPWAVLRELDALKKWNADGDGEAENSSHLGRSARAAINFVHELLLSKSNRIRGQTGSEEKKAEVFSAHNADDRILQTCLKLKSEGMPTVLYTNDKNLANKSMVSGVEAFSSVGLRKGLQKALSQLPEFSSSNVSSDASDGKKRFLNPGAASASYKQILGLTKQPLNDQVVSGIHDNNGNKHQAEGEANVENVHILFTLTWHWIYVYTWLYCRALCVPATNYVPPPSTDLAQRDVTLEDCRACLQPLVVSVIQLYDRLNAALRLSPIELSVNSVDVRGLFDILITFLGEFPVPASHPDVTTAQFAGAAEHVRPGGLVLYLLGGETRSKMDNGFNQLQELKRLLQLCRGRLREIRRVDF